MKCNNVVTDAFDNRIEWRSSQAPSKLTDFVDSFWMLTNLSDDSIDVVVLPDGRIDLLFTDYSGNCFGALLMGLETEPSLAKIPPNSRMFAVSFNLLAAEYVLKTDVSHFLNSVKNLPDDFWGIVMEDLDDFEQCCRKVSTKIMNLVNQDVEIRKQTLFEHIYKNNGSITIRRLTEITLWNSRQINRYFNQMFGLPLKVYCNILRFRASLVHLKQGKLYPEQNYTDQAHFIKEVRKYAGVSPKVLRGNPGSRFIHLSTMPESEG